VAPSFPAEEYRCPVCGIDYPSVTVGWAMQRVVDGPAAAAARLRGVPDELRHRPGDGWSLLEYGCHLRDVYATYTIRLHRGRTEDRPALEPMFNDLRAARFRYNELPLDAVLAEMAANARGLGEQIAATSHADLARIVTRRPDEVRSVLWLVRQTAHETVHHLGDLGVLYRDVGQPGHGW
jgi:hypothetical protein